MKFTDDKQKELWLRDQRAEKPRVEPKSFNSAKTREEVEVGTFGWALINLKNGLRVCREGNRAKKQYIEMQVPDLGSKMNLPYLFICALKSDGLYELVPWQPTQNDLMAEDWELFKG